MFIFATVSVFFIYVSRKSLFHPQSHGFYRIFAWESILVLALLNYPHWFEDPYSLHQLISWAFLIISIFLVVYGLHLLQVVGKPNEERNAVELLAFEKTTYLVTVGIYKYIRHPLYSSLLFLAWGAFLKDISLISFCLVFTTSFFLLQTAKRDESECLSHFGNTYQAYMLRTRMFIPFVF